MREFILLTCVLLLPIAHAQAKPPKSNKAALKVLNLLKQVDGAGSGLDADTLRGMTPAQLQTGTVVVKDSQGKVVGAVLDAGHVVRSLGGQSVMFRVAADGFTNDGFSLAYAS